MQNKPKAGSKPNTSARSKAQQPATTHKLTVILNPKSGSAGDDFKERIETALKDKGADFEILETDPELGGREVAEKAVEQGATHILACGGDGTIMDVVNGIAKQVVEDEDDNRPILSIIPGGTANLLAAALEIPKELDEAIDIALNGRDTMIDLGKCRDSYFALGLGLGLTERLVSQASAQEKEKFGKLAYVKAMAMELGAKPVTFTFKLDKRSSKRSRGVAIVIANSGTIGGKLQFAPRAKMNDGVLDLCILHRFRLLDAFRLMLRSILGSMPSDRAVSFYQAKRIEIHSNPPLDLQIDGEVVDMKTPLVVEIIEKAIRVRVKQEAEIGETTPQKE
jgi:diacylglycerol kinase (ATP)